MTRRPAADERRVNDPGLLNLAQGTAGRLRRERARQTAARGRGAPSRGRARARGGWRPSPTGQPPLPMAAAPSSAPRAAAGIAGSTGRCEQSTTWPPASSELGGPFAGGVGLVAVAALGHVRLGDHRLVRGDGVGLDRVGAASGVRGVDLGHPVGSEDRHQLVGLRRPHGPRAVVPRPRLATRVVSWRGRAAGRPGGRDRSRRGRRPGRGTRRGRRCHGRTTAGPGPPRGPARAPRPPRRSGSKPPSLCPTRVRRTGGPHLGGPVADLLRRALDDVVLGRQRGPRTTLVSGLLTHLPDGSHGPLLGPVQLALRQAPVVVPLAVDQTDLHAIRPLVPPAGAVPPDQAAGRRDRGRAAPWSWLIASPSRASAATAAGRPLARSGPVRPSSPPPPRAARRAAGRGRSRWTRRAACAPPASVRSRRRAPRPGARRAAR